MHPIRTFLYSPPSHHPSPSEFGECIRSDEKPSVPPPQVECPPYCNRATSLRKPFCGIFPAKDPEEEP